MELRGQSVIITGGGSGLGAECARRMAAAGAKVCLLDLNAEGVAAVAKEIDGLGLVCDVADGPQAEAAVAEARAAHGPARVLVNCAGIAPPKRIVGRNGPMPLADFETVIRVNLIGSFNLLRLAAAEMAGAEPLAEGERGVIISTASVAAMEGQIGQAAYAASKAGILGMMLPAARELAKFGIRVMTVAPGLIATPLLLSMPQEIQDSLVAQIPFPKRFGKPAEFARLVMDIVENPMLNGEVIRLDGGMRLS